MANLVETIYKKVIRPYQYTILLVALIILFSVTGYYGYKYYFKEINWSKYISRPCCKKFITNSVKATKGRRKK